MFRKRIICIHAVSPVSMPVQHLERYLNGMKKLGYRFVALPEILRDRCKGRVLALTVDDAYKVCITNLLPVLEKYNITATLFVPPGLLGLPANHEELTEHRCYPNEEMMTLEDLRYWLEKGQQVGFHTHKHINLKQLSGKEIEEDFHAGFEKLQKWGIKTDLFAYPFGYLPIDRQKFEEELRSACFKYAFTVEWGDVNADAPYYINRVCIGDREPLWWSVMKTIGCLDWYQKFKQGKQ